VINNDKHAVKLWDIYKNYYNQTYSTSEEDEKRSKNFIETLSFITKTNDPLKRKPNLYRLGLNQFASMDFEELIKHYTGVLVPDKLEMIKSGKPVFNRHNLTSTRRKILPTHVDYRPYMNAIENQGGCSSCYAFASLATVEGTYALKKQQRINLSKQQIIDCVSQNQCQPWFVHLTLDYIKQHHGLAIARSYPYQAAQNTCKSKSKSTGAIIDYGLVQPNDEEAMKLALNTFGPLAVRIGITKRFETYRDGILDIPSCSTKDGHAVVIVGYGTEHGEDYWLVRNSWGTGWGDKGYFKMARNKNNMCGIASWVYYVTV
jgi:C1A family cysteine protease